MEKTKREIERRGVRSLREKERKGERKGREEERRGNKGVAARVKCRV